MVRQLLKELEYEKIKYFIKLLDSYNNSGRGYRLRTRESD
ncbi:hypothetical protein KL86DYS1_30596 [uncultured Dysgonomonas sp.]|uniref:Uncharacterized protein n=1 Tax=uncultured Dysgonomonas sp. TaxID=206096 RepID=A0A212JW51_9BACT|nr:hypothetical protein KL86DYS1_30596 [uncultured Dysgonomonas sp.]